jgi:hypothetical protein
VGVAVEGLDRKVRDDDPSQQRSDPSGFIRQAVGDERRQAIDFLEWPEVAKGSLVACGRRVEPSQRATDLGRVGRLVEDRQVTPERHRPTGRPDVRTGIDVVGGRRDRQPGGGEPAGEREAVGEDRLQADEARPDLDPGDDR